MKHLVIGLGEVGTAIQRVLRADGIDLKTTLPTDPVWQRNFNPCLHVCIPWSTAFVEMVQAYQAQFQPRYTVIHSTVPVGTSALLRAVSSPVRGLHPHLEQGVRTFVKMVGGLAWGAGDVAAEFRRHGLRVLLLDKSDSAELAKILDTEYYRACIEFAHRAKDLADVHGVPFHEVYTLANETYNDGYARLGHPEYVRPVLQAIPGPIGGHCVVPNSKLLQP